MKTTVGDGEQITKSGKLENNQSAFFTGANITINNVTVDGRCVIYIRGVSDISLTYTAGETSSEKLNGKYYRKQLERIIADDTGVTLVLIDGNNVRKFWVEDNYIQVMTTSY
jgi:hypothetical protein